jgi:cell division protein FtsN
MLEEPQIVEVPPSNNGVAVAPKPAQDNGANANNGTTTAMIPPKKAPNSINPPTSAPTGAPATANNAPTQPKAGSTPNANGAPPTAADANTGYLLQVGAYKTAADAEQQRARLAFQGFESKVTQRDAGGVTYYRVRIGPFSKFEEMNTTRQRLSDAGVDTAVIRFSKQ